MDFRHSSGYAWSLIRKLDLQRANNPPKKTLNTADDIANEIKQKSVRKPNTNFETNIQEYYRRTFQACPEKAKLARNVNVLELEGPLKQLKNGKAAGIDGLHPDRFIHLRPRARAWLASAFS